jgi:hypothetical protein
MMPVMGDAVMIPNTLTQALTSLVLPVRRLLAPYKCYSKFQFDSEKSENQSGFSKFETGRIAACSVQYRLKGIQHHHQQISLALWLVASKGSESSIAPVLALFHLSLCIDPLPCHRTSDAPTITVPCLPNRNPCF